MSRLHITLLGTFAVSQDHTAIPKFGSPQIRVLLIYLVVDTEHLYHRDFFKQLLWPNQTAKNADANFRQSLYRLRDKIGDKEANPPFLQIDKQTIKWNSDSDFVLDVKEFQQAANRVLGENDFTTAFEQLQIVLNYYQGDFLDGFTINNAPDFDHWVTTTREQLAQQLSSAISHVVNLAEKDGQYQQMVVLAHHQLKFRPWHEPAHRHLMRAFALLGQRAEALAQYDRCCDILKQTLNTEPDIETEYLYQRILNDELKPPIKLPVTPPEPEFASLVLPTQALPPHGILPDRSLMPLHRNPHFVGRDADLRALAKTLDDGGAAAVSQIETAAATGLGGIGKTQLACEFVHRYGQFFPGGVFWMSFDNADAIPAEIAACGGANALELHPDFEKFGLDKQVRLVQRAWQMPIPRLLIFDNCEDPILLDQWRPTTGGCRVLVTSRRGDWELTLGVTMLALGVLSREESIDLLYKHCPNANKKTLCAIAEEVGDLPIALHLAGSYLYRYRRSVSPEQYLDELRDPKLLDHPSLTTGGRSPTGHIQHVGRTFALSYDQLDLDDKQDTLAHTLLVHTAQFAPGEPIWYDLLVKTVGLNPNQPVEARTANDAFARLIELGMIETEENNVLRMHRLVAAFVHDVAPAKAKASQKAVEKVVFEETTQRNKEVHPLPLMRRQLHLRTVVDLAQVREDVESAKLCHELGVHLWQIGDFQGALPYHEKALAIRLHFLGENHADTATSLVQIGRVLRGLGRSSETKSYFERSLAIRMAILGREHQDTAESLENIGRYFYEMGDVESALSYIQEALEIIHHVLGPENALAAEYNNNIAICLRALDRLDDAFGYFERALSINETVLGLEHPHTALTCHNIGDILRRLGRLSEAQTYLERALTIRRQAYGSEHHDTALTLLHMARLFYDMGKCQEAQQAANQALDILTGASGEPHHSIDEARQILSQITECMDKDE